MGLALRSSRAATACHAGAEAAAAPELDGVAIPEGGEVVIQLAAGGYGQVLNVAVVKRRDNRLSSWSQG